MRNIKLVIEYDGTNYHGWQSQVNALAIQDIIAGAIYKLTGERCALVGSCRTDAGVHAIGQVANFKTTSSISAERFPHALNSLMPDDIVVKSSEEVSLDFHSRYSSKGRKYRYIIYNGKYPSAFLLNRAFYVPCKLDFESMRKAALFFRGTHDFSAFRASGSSTKTSIRTITEVTFEQLENDKAVIDGFGMHDAHVFVLEMAGDGFLYNMVRIIAGTLIEVGRGKIPSEAIPAIIKSRDRTKAGRTAPAHGLYLVEVYY